MLPHTAAGAHVRILLPLRRSRGRVRCIHHVVRRRRHGLDKDQGRIADIGVLGGICVWPQNRDLPVEMPQSDRHARGRPRTVGGVDRYTCIGATRELVDAVVRDCHPK